MTTMQELITYSVTDSAIAEMRAKFMGLRVHNFEDVEGYENCKEARKAVRDKRLEIEERRKELKSESLAFGRAVDTEARRITANIEVVEAHLVSQMRIVDDEKKRREDAAIAAAKEKLNKRVELLQAVNASFRMDEVAAWGDEDFDMVLTDAETRFNAEQRRKAEEAEKLRVLQAEINRKDAELRKIEEEAARLAAEDLARNMALVEAKKKAEADAAKQIADQKLFEEIRAQFPTLETAWVEIARLRKLLK